MGADTIIVTLSSTIMGFLRSEIAWRTIIAASVNRQSVLVIMWVYPLPRFRC